MIGRQLAAGASLVAAITLAASVPAFAHPTATTAVTVLVDEGAVDVTIASDTEALRLKLDAMQRTLTECIDLRVDGVRAALTQDGTTSLEDGRVAFHLRGSVPPAAKQLTWTSSLMYGSYPVVMRRARDSHETTEWLQGAETSAPYALASGGASRSRVSRIAQYVALGFTHILPNGLDHILFVLGLFFLTTRLRAMLAQVTAFTVAHSITLGLTLYGVVSMPAPFVEPLIAMSIAYVAFENLVTTELKPWRLALVFGFGLLHGMGFADALSRLDLPRSEFLTTLVGFNVGVEAGQL